MSNRTPAASAAEVFNERGLEVSLDEVARHAGVGVGTVYRRFPSKAELVEALFLERIDSIAALAEAAGEAADPWSGLVSFMEQAAGQLRDDLKQTDIPFIIFVLTEGTRLAREVSPEIWRRYLRLVLDGMRPQRDGVTPLPVPALLPEEMEKTMRQSAPRHH